MAKRSFWQIATAPTTLLGAGIIAGFLALVPPATPEGRDLAWPFRPDCCGLIDILAFSPDGTELTAAGNSGAVARWDVGTGQDRGSTQLAPGYNLSHTLAADGKTLAAVRWDNAVMIRDLEESQDPDLVPASGRVISSVGFSLDGKILAEGGQDGVITLRNVANDRECGTLRGGRAGILCLAFSPDGTVVAAGDQAGTVTLWDTATARIKSVMYAAAGLEVPGRRTAIRDLEFSPDGTELAVVTYFDSSVRRWDVVAGQERAALRGHDHPVSSVAYSPGEALIVSGATDGTIKVWEAASGLERASFRGHLWQVSALAVSPDGHVLASADADACLRLWDMNRLQEAKTALRPGGVREGSVSLALPRSGQAVAGREAIKRRILSRLVPAARSRFSSPPPPRSGEHIS
jgi:WD40 repeat protein